MAVYGAINKEPFSEEDSRCLFAVRSIYAPMAALTALLLLLSACGPKVVPPPPAGRHLPKGKPYTVFGRSYQPYTKAHGYEERGLASWYGPKFQGRLTSNGEVYDMGKMTAAHKLLPMNTWVEVVNQNNGQKSGGQDKRPGAFRGRAHHRPVQSRGPKAGEFSVLGPAPVYIRALGKRRPGAAPPPQDAPTAVVKLGPFTVQVGAFTQESNAYRLAAMLRTRHQDVSVVEYNRGDMVFRRVRVGKLDSLDQAEKLKRPFAAGKPQTGLCSSLVGSWGLFRISVRQLRLFGGAALRRS